MRKLILLAAVVWPAASFSQTMDIAKQAKPVADVLEKPSQPAGQAEFNVADRLAVENIMAAYTFSVDEYHYDAYFDLYWPDAKFLVREPGYGVQQVPIAKLRPAHIKLFDRFKAKGLQRRHMMTSTYFLYQDPTRIRIVAEALMAEANKQTNQASLLTPIVYEGWFEKRGGVWKIIRWQGNLDVTSNGTAGKPEDTLGYWLKQNLPSKN